MQSWTTTAIVLKRINYGEADRILTLLTPGEGKVVAVAKSIRKLSSSQRAYLEPGNLVTVQLRQTHALPIVAQTQLQEQYAATKQELRRVKQLFEVLELADLLFVENLPDETGFALIESVLQRLNQPARQLSEIRQLLNQLLMHLGYQDIEQTSYRSILEYAAAVAERPARSYDFLSVRQLEVIK